MKSCYACLHCYDGADQIKRCRVNGLPVSPALEDDCNRFIREPGSDDSVPPWYIEAWCVTTSMEGRGD